VDESSKLASFPLVGDADPVPGSLLLPSADDASTLALLYEVSRELASILDREELFRRIEQRVKRLVKHQVFSVMLWNEQAQLLESVFTMRYSDAMALRLRLRLNEGLTGTAAAERRVVRVNDVQTDARYIQCGTGVDARSELVIPLILQDRLIGVLDLESMEPHAFTAEHERMMATLGSYIAIALENARLYEEARENQRRLYDDLSTAREIQRQLLPTGAREIPGLDLAAGYCSARELGGDFYDFLPYGKGRLAVALGDVSGKGTAAALFGSLAIGTMREHVVEHPCRPSEMLALLNNRLHGARLDARFIAMVFAVYDAGARRLTVANAGGPYPLFLRNGDAQQVRVEGIPLGLFPGTQYDEVMLELQPGDTVLFASDGILEAENTEREEFGHERLGAVLKGVSPDDSSAVISETILSVTSGYSGDNFAPQDDRTLLVLRMTDHSSSDFSKLPIIY
jgi:sigma-B regulation protein RsbU (phosphoserine phosphatase)